MMRRGKAWRIVSGAALIFLVIGVLGIGVGFFMGSSPVAIQNHGELTEYFERLRINWDILRSAVASLWS